MTATAATVRPLHLLFVGDGELGGELRRKCHVIFDQSDPGLTGGQIDGPKASFAGFLNQSEIVQAYVAADLLVLPSDSGETWGLVTNEAMACGTPAVVSEQCGSAEDLVAPLDRRLVFRCGDVSDLAAAIGHAMAAPPQREASLRTADTYHMRHTVDTVKRLYCAIDNPDAARTDGESIPLAGKK